MYFWNLKLCNWPPSIILVTLHYSFFLSNHFTRCLFISNQSLDHKNPSNVWGWPLRPTQRAMIQSHVWTNFMSLDEPEFDPKTWVFYKDEYGLLNPIWTTLPKASKACKELKHCNCQKNCSTNGKCKCKEYSLPCNELCCCGGYCV